MAAAYTSNVAPAADRARVRGSGASHMVLHRDPDGTLVGHRG